MTGRWDDHALALVRQISADLTSLDALLEVLKTTRAAEPTLSDLDRLTKQALGRQLDLLAHLKE